MYLHESRHKAHTLGHLLEITMLKKVMADTTVLLSCI